MYGENFNFKSFFSNNTNVSIYCKRVGKKTALLQAEASACVFGLANVLFCALAVYFFFSARLSISFLS
jgi:hypothetical protein